MAAIRRHTVWVLQKKGLGAKQSGTKVICIIIRIFAYQARTYEYQLCNFYINLNIN